MSVLICSNYFECRVSKYGNWGAAKREHRTPVDGVEICYIPLLHRVYTQQGPHKLRTPTAEVSIRPETQDRSTISSAKRLAGALYIDKNKQSKSFFHRHSRLLGTSHRHCKRAGLIKGVNRSPGPTIYHALMLNASSLSSIRETVCIAS